MAVTSSSNYRYSPYAGSAGPCALQLWSAGFSETHVSKTTPNADKFFVNGRGVGVFDGVGGVVELGLDPAEMSQYMCEGVETELGKRLQGNAQRYDRSKQLELQSSVLPGSGGWLRNLCAATFFECDSLGSTTVGVCHITGDRIDYAMLGDIQMYVYRQAAGCAFEVKQTRVVRIDQGGPLACPAQAGLYQASDMSRSYVEQIFKPCEYGVIANIRLHDTIVMVSDGVIDNVGHGKIQSLVSDAYANWQTSPEDLAKDIVGVSLAGAHRRNGKPDDTTCVVAYVCYGR